MKKVILAIFLLIVASALYSCYEEGKRAEQAAADEATQAAKVKKAQADFEAKLTPQQRQKREQERIKEERDLSRANAIRLQTFRVVESSLVQMGVDATVGAIGDASTVSNQHMVIMGPGVTHLFMRQFAAEPDMRRTLLKVGFYDVTFMSGRGITDWVGKWNLFYNTLE